MPQPSRRAARGAAAAVLLALSPTLVGCGFNAQTNELYQPAVGTNLRTSQVDVLGAVVVAESGEGRLVASFVNNSENRADALTGVSGAGPDVDLQVDAPGELELPPGTLVNLADEEPILVSGAGLVPGSLVNLRYSFSTAEAVEFQAVVVAPTEAYEDLAPGAGGSGSSEGGVVIGGGGDGGTAPLDSDG